MAITPVDDGDAAPSSGAGTSTHTFGSQSSTGPFSFVKITWIEDTGSDRTITSATWGGAATTIPVQEFMPTAVEDGIGAAILYIAGAQTGNIVVNFSGDVEDSQITKVSLDNVNTTFIDTDFDAQESTSLNLDALSSPGLGGIRLAVYGNTSDASGCTWTNATEIADLDAGTFRHSAAWDLGDDGTTINCSRSDSDSAIAGLSIAEAAAAFVPYHYGMVGGLTDLTGGLQ
jgi:hypothetical protein